MDEKEKELENPTDTENTSAEKSSQDTLYEQETAEQIHDEMEQLAAVFQEELDKAKEEAEKGTEEPCAASCVPETQKVQEEKEEPLAEEELCACCGENKRGTVKDPDSPYCETCEAGLRHYPFDILNVILAIAAIALVFYGGFIFANHTETYVPVLKADKLMSEKKVYSALDSYTVAANAMLNNHINGELVYKKELLIAYKLGMMNVLPETAEKIKAFEFKLPHFSALRHAVDEAESYMVTSLTCNQLVAPYETKEPKDVPYDDLIAKLDALLAATPEPLEEEPKENVYQPAPPVYKPAMLAFYKYYAALLAEKDVETQLQYAEEIRAAAPDALWLYGSLLGDLYAKTGKDIEPICKALEDFNLEDDTPSLLRVEQKRIEKNPEEAIELAQKMIQAESPMKTEFLRQQALCYLALQDFNKALEKASSAFEFAVSGSSPSIQVCNTYALCALAAKNEKEFSSVEQMFKENSIPLSKEVLSYKNGSISLQTILEEGDCDL